MRANTVFRFELYVIGNAPHSRSAILNLRDICDSHLAERYEIEIIDVGLQPRRALEQGILITPMLVRAAPGPVCKIAGNLSNRQAVIEALILQC